MKIVWTTLGALGFLSGAAFIVFWLLAWTGHGPSEELMVITCGVMLLVTGLFELRAAVNKNAVLERGKWARSNVKVGRLSMFAMGTGFCAIGGGMLGWPWLPKQFELGMAAVFMASFALSCYGKTLDGRRAREELASKQADAGPTVR